MGSTILTNRVATPLCEVTYEGDDLIVGLILKGYDVDDEQWVEISRTRADQTSPYTYGQTFTPVAPYTQFVVEMMVFLAVDLAERNFEFGISSRAFTLDTSIPDQLTALMNQIASLSSLVGANPPTNAIGIVDTPEIIATIETTEAI